MDAMADVDFGRRSGDYAEHRPGFPDSFYDRIERIHPLDGACALDLGTGPGIVALALACRGAKVTGVDIAEPQIRAAEQVALAEGLSGRCSFRVGSAESLEIEDASLDLVTAGQCWHWFDERAAMNEVLRVLKPKGTLVVAHYCYLPRHDALARASEELVLRFNPEWTMAGMTGLYPQHVDSLIDGGFLLREQFCYDHDRLFSHEAWRGRMRTCNGVGSGALSDTDVVAYDRALASLLEESFPEPVPVRHRIWATVVTRP